MTTENFDNILTLETCPICLDNIELCAYNYIKTECKHCFHASCFLTNAKRNGYGCPCCRKELVASDSNGDSNNDSESDSAPYYDYETDLSLLAFRYFINRVEGENRAEGEGEDNNQLDEDDSDESVWSAEEMYQRGHEYYGQQSVPNLSIEHIANKLSLMGLNYEDLVALYVLPHKDNTNDLCLYDSQWIAMNERNIRDLLRGR